MQRQERRLYATIRNFFYNVYNNLEGVSTLYCLIELFKQMDSVAPKAKDEPRARLALPFLLGALHHSFSMLQRIVDHISSQEIGMDVSNPNNYVIKAFVLGMNTVIAGGATVLFDTNYIEIDENKNPILFMSAIAGLWGLSYFLIEEFTHALVYRNNDSELNIQYFTEPREYADRPLPIRLIDGLNATKTAVFIFQFLKGLQAELGATWMQKDIVAQYVMLLTVNESLHLARKLTMNPHPIESMLYKKDCPASLQGKLTIYKPDTKGQLKNALYTVGPRLAALVMTLGMLEALSNSTTENILPEVNVLTGCLLVSSYNAIVEGIKNSVSICSNPASMFRNFKNRLKGYTQVSQEEPRAQVFYNT